MQNDTDAIQAELLGYVASILEIASRYGSAVWSPEVSASLEDAGNSLIDLSEGLRERIGERERGNDLPEASLSQ